MTNKISNAIEANLSVENYASDSRLFVSRKRSYSVPLRADYSRTVLPSGQEPGCWSCYWASAACSWISLYRSIL